MPTDYLDSTISIPYGSQLYGTATDDSDLDLLILYCESEADLLARRYPKIEPIGITNDLGVETDEKFMSFGQFVTLLGKGDPHWSPIALQYPNLKYLTDLLVSQRTVERMIKFAAAQSNDTDPKRRAHGFRTALAVFDLFTTGTVRYPLNQQDADAYASVREGHIDGSDRTHGIIGILTDLTIHGSLREEPNMDLAAEEIMRVYQEVWRRRQQ